MGNIQGDRMARAIGATDLTKTYPPGVRPLDGLTLAARARNAAVAVPAVMAAFDAHGVPVASVTLARPSLDDVYLHYAGRSFANADADARRAPEAVAA